MSLDHNFMNSLALKQTHVSDLQSISNNGMSQSDLGFGAGGNSIKNQIDLIRDMSDAKSTSKLGKFIMETNKVKKLPSLDSEIESDNERSSIRNKINSIKE